MQMQPIRLLRFRNRFELKLLLSLVVNRLRTVLAVKGPLRPRRSGAPLTAPGRSEERFLIRGKGGLGNLWPRHLNIAPLHGHNNTPQGTCTAAGGLDAKNFLRLPTRGGTFSLDISFYRTGRLPVRDLSGEPLILLELSAPVS